MVFVSFCIRISYPVISLGLETEKSRYTDPAYFMLLRLSNNRNFAQCLSDVEVV